MATEDEIRVGWAATVGQIDGWGAYPYTPGQIHTPCAIVTQVDVEFDIAMQRGGDRFVVRAFLLTSGDLESAQKVIGLHVLAVRDAIAADPTLGGVAMDARVTRKRGDSDGQIQMRDGQTYVVAEIETEVYA